MRATQAVAAWLARLFQRLEFFDLVLGLQQLLLDVRLEFVGLGLP